MTGKVLVDRFRIGTLEVHQARKSMSLAAPSGALTRKPERGDVVLVARSAPSARLWNVSPSSPQNV